MPAGRPGAPDRSFPDLSRFQTPNDKRTTLSEMKFEESEHILLKVARCLRDLFGLQ